MFHSFVILQWLLLIQIKSRSVCIHLNIQWEHVLLYLMRIVSSIKFWSKEDSTLNNSTHREYQTKWNTTFLCSNFLEEVSEIQKWGMNLLLTISDHYSPLLIYLFFICLPKILCSPMQSFFKKTSPLSVL